MDRRVFLAAMAGASAFALQACASPAPSPVPTSTPTASPTLTSTPRPVPLTLATPAPIRLPARTPDLVRVALPGGTLSELPGEGSLLALTVDDGADSAVVSAYIAFVKRTGLRLTFFLNGSYAAWTENAAALKPLVESGQIQLGNHTWSHADLTSLSDDDVIEELERNEQFILDTFAVTAKPYFRPPFGYHDARVDRLAASIGYTVPTLWYGSLSDSGLITSEQLIGFAEQWLLPQHIVIGHANFPTVVDCFDRIEQIIDERELQTVTLNDVFDPEL
ncbi:polysaccharide deacetylase family protein [Microbacteriaceae bacterium VKM Ac-2855]|nr:polysaccharide deacetylase family protein [Microbacteriaceae bacterium VKM Ac-2855]